MNQLITPRPSSGVELGRWVLQHHQIAYTERSHAPIFHVLALKFKGVGAEDYPLFVTASGDKIKGNPDIVQHVERNIEPVKRLIPDSTTEPDLHKEVTEFTDWLYNTVSGDVVNYAYYYLLQYRRAVWPSLTTGVPWYEKLIWFIAFPIMRSLMYAGLKLDKTVADAALKDIYKTFDTTDAMLADGRQYLAGGRLTYSDLSLAALYAPMILAEGYQGFLPNQAACPGFMAKVFQELRQRPTGRFIQRIYDTHRPVGAD